MGRVLCVFLLILVALPGAAHAGELKAGVGEVDASWHVGSGAGQHASTGSFVDQHGFDPGVHSYHFARSYGVQSRLKIRAIVVEGPSGERVAIVKNDLYIPQDLLYRRTAQLLEQGDSGITRETLTMAVTHNHSSPYYSTPSWGVWTFQDFFDIRFFNYYAERMARAVEEAAAKLVPVRVGGAVRKLADIHRNVPGRATADDGTPAGFPESYGDHDLTVVRFDDISDPANPKPLANLVNYAVHPEGLEGNDIISADWLGPFERMTDRASGAMTIYTQGAVGNHEPERSAWHQPSERREYYRRDYAQGERLARELADTTLAASADIERGTAVVPFETGSEVKMVDRWFPGPLSHPLPTVAGCRTDSALAGRPRGPVANECEQSPISSPFDPGVSTDTLQAQGIPVPENLSVPAYTGLEEDVNVHLQALRIGDILFTICPCEQWADQSLNIKSRTNLTRGDEHYGYLWDCVPNGDTITQAECDRMHAQVMNDANGWDAPEYALEAESEPTDPAAIKGNYTHGELPEEHSYRLTVPVSMANDYNGYIVTYREYQRGDHYRKSLNAWGPHASDYMATRLVGLGGQLKGGPAPPKELHEDAKVAPDLAHNDARSTALGESGKQALDNYEALLAPDRAAGTALPEWQPEDVIERFDAATFTFNGGSNYVDLPEVRVERKIGAGTWQTYAEQSGEVPVTLKFPELSGAATHLTGQRWEWTAHFEAFVSDIDTGSGRFTPAGTYRFVANGVYRDEKGRAPYSITSEEFDVKPWDGITVEDLRVEPDRSVSFIVGPRTEVGPIDYPNSYEAPRKAAFIRDERVALRDRPPNDHVVTYFCFTCSFRPWLDAGNASQATVTIVRSNGKTKTVPAFERDGRWVTDYKLDTGQAAFVAAGAVVDHWGNFNGAATERVGDPPATTVPLKPPKKRILQ